MSRVLAAELAELFKLELVGRFLLILGGRIVLTLALGAIEAHDDSHCTSSTSTSSKLEVLRKSQKRREVSKRGGGFTLPLSETMTN